MSRIGNISRRILLGAALLAGAAWAVIPVFAQAAQTQQPTPTREEYDAYIAAHNEKVPEQKIKLLDDFVAKYPKSTYMPYILSDYYLTYYALKDYPKAISSADRLLDYGEKIDPASQLQARYTRAQAFLAIAGQVKDPAQLNAARESARQGLKDLDALKKPDATPQKDFDAQKQGVTGIFESVLAATSVGLKDAAGAMAAYKALLALDPTNSDPSGNALIHYKLGAIYQQMNPPQFLDAIWEFARAVALKGPNTAQIHDYLSKVILNYQGGSVCDSLLKDEVNQLETLAAGGGDRPTTYTLPSADDLSKAQQDTANFITNLKAGGDAGKLMWLATCGLEYPEIVTKLISIDTPDTGPIVLHVFTGATADETQNGTVADMEVILDGSQPEAKRLKVEDELRFGGTLTGYDQSPFMLHWTKGKVNPDDIPSETGKKPAPKKKPGGEK
jgi:tetratricopeptide (TPR) repeat protein